MDKVISVYGLSKDQAQQLALVRPDKYRVVITDCVTDLLASSSLLSIVNAEALDQANRNVLLGYYLDVDTNCETVVWLGERMRPDKFFSYDGFCDMMTDIEHVLEKASANYELSDLFYTEYSFLPARAITDCLENEIRSAFYKKYGSTPDPQMAARLRDEWTALVEVDCVPELAAVYELCRWLKHNKHPYRISGEVLSGFIPYLLGITEANPLPPHQYCPKCYRHTWVYSHRDGFGIPTKACPHCGTELVSDGHDFVWQEYCSYGRVPSYVFYLPEDLQPQILAWANNHWLKTIMGDDWVAAQPYEEHLVRGSIHFLFELERCNISTDFHSRAITFKDCQNLIEQDPDWKRFGKYHPPIPKDFDDYITLKGILEQSCTEQALALVILLSDPWSNTIDYPAYRENIFDYLKGHDFIDKDAFRGMTSVRKGKGLPVVTEEMRNSDDCWIAEYCNQIKWLPSRAEMFSELIFNLKSRIEVE